jgi:hypothetical protein
MELIHHIMRTRHFQSNLFYFKEKNLSLENLALKQKTFRIVKEQHDVARTSCDHQKPTQGYLHRRYLTHWLRVIARSCNGSDSSAGLVEPTGIEPVTSCLQSRRSPS